MKKHYLFVLILFFGFNASAEVNLTNHKEITVVDEITYTDNLIKVAGKCIGKFEVKVKDIVLNNKEKSTLYEVCIFSDAGKMVANLFMQVNDKTKKKKLNIIDASLKTLADNVSHNPSNFINYGDLESVENEKFEVPQFDNVVKYMLTYKYL